MRNSHFTPEEHPQPKLATWLAVAIVTIAALALPQRAMAQTIGTRWAWGSDVYGQLGDNRPSPYFQNIPVAVSATTQLTSAVAISAGEFHSIALKNDGSVFTWGLNSYGQIGNGVSLPVPFNTYVSLPYKIGSLTGIKTVAAGGYHCLALTGAGAVKAWGYNNKGQLGNSNTTDSSTPVNVLNLANVTAIAAGGLHSLALQDGGTVWAWGNGTWGQLGNNDTTDHSTRVQVSGLTGITAIAAGWFHSLALKNDGTVWAWGCNTNGQLGDGTFNFSKIPVQVHNLSGVVAIAAGGSDQTENGYAGGSHSLALKNDGTVWAWGYNVYGQLGNNSYSDSDLPVQVSGLTAIRAIAAGGWHSLALTSTGTVKAWGYNHYGELGNNTSTDSPMPVSVSNITGMTHIAAGGYHSLAISCTAPAAPTLDSATGDCNGVNLAWTAPTTRCTSSYNVYRSNNATCPVGTLTLVATAVTTTSYADASAVAGTAYTYVVRGCCDLYGTYESVNSNCLPATRTAVPAVPAAPGVADVDPCALSGVSITWSDVAGATGYDLRVDSTTTVTGVTSPHTYSPGNSSSHSYQVRSKNTCGSSSWSTGTAGTDAVCAVPPETSAGTGGAGTAMTWSADKFTIGWQAVSGIVSGYRLYKGAPADLPSLLSASTDSCTRYDGPSLSYALNGTTDQPANGSFYWFLVDAYNGAGEGPAGNATAGARIVNGPGICF